MSKSLINTDLNLFGFTRAEIENDPAKRKKVLDHLFLREEERKEFFEGTRKLIVNELGKESVMALILDMGFKHIESRDCDGDPDKMIIVAVYDLISTL